MLRPRPESNAIASNSSLRLEVLVVAPGVVGGGVQAEEQQQHLELVIVLVAALLDTFFATRLTSGCMSICC